ncbi:MAG TPA: FAD-linked oxidase C-terminal domain-containing protein [Spirochaetota bacterium]|nr:FAD-linked oxidase C-terminal domain-containing protein [Spirochaetota bacterium]HRZ27878.1 FAD-linked oxidase C-terminal domain-containing protein [Spirochaetota bacterium]HSA14675.1 FAD-linked oxidase C-terminal domain-containing protein [Spirochaetota bacterium]
MNRIETVIRRIEEALGQGRAAFEKDILEAYSRDETSDLSAMPDVLVRAESTAEVSAVLRICNEEMVPVVPRGAGSGVTGGAVPVNGGVVLSLERMNRIIEIDRENMVAVVEPGAITGDIQKAALAEGLMYPPDPASLESCSIGGNVAEIAGGPRAVKYGTTRDYVLGLQFVLADGSVISTGGKFVKNATGYNLAGIILGSEGTLAVITKIHLRLIPAPRHSLDLLAPFGSLEEAMEAVYRILLSKTVPAAVEFMEEDAIRLVAGFHRKDIPFPEARAHLLIQIDGDSEESLHRDIEKIAAAIGLPGEEIIVAAGGPQRERLWKARRAIREAITAESPVFLAEDCVVPRSRIPAFLAGLKELFNARGLRSIMFGHAGDGNVHVDVLKGDMDYEKWKELVPGLRREIYLRAIGLGGTITGEHGIGCLRRGYLPLAASSAEIELMKRIKKAFDPNGIINPGKIIP